MGFFGKVIENRRARQYEKEMYDKMQTRFMKIDQIKKERVGRVYKYKYRGTKPTGEIIIITQETFDVQPYKKGDILAYYEDTKQVRDPILLETDMGGKGTYVKWNTFKEVRYMFDRSIIYYIIDKNNDCLIIHNIKTGMSGQYTPKELDRIAEQNKLTIVSGNKKITGRGWNKLGIENIEPCEYLHF